MGVSSDEISAHGDQDHGVRDVDAFLVITHEASPSCHPSEGALDDPAARQNLETLLIIRPADDLDDEVEIGGFVHEFEPVICAVSKQMLDPRPALAQSLQNRLGSRAVGDVGSGQFDHQKPPISIDSDMTLAANDLFASIVTP